MPLQRPMPEIEIVVVTLASPLLVGLYKDGRLFETIKKEEKTSEILPKIFQQILSQYAIKSIYFARGPGSFMAIKLVYIFLKTLQICMPLRLFGCLGFEFNNHQPIKAIGNLFFLEENGKIVTKKMSGESQGEFSLPSSLDELRCSEEISPLYVIPAVKV